MARPHQFTIRAWMIGVAIVGIACAGIKVLVLAYGLPGPGWIPSLVFLILAQAVLLGPFLLVGLSVLLCFSVPNAQGTAKKDAPAADLQDI